MNEIGYLPRGYMADGYLPNRYLWSYKTIEDPPAHLVGAFRCLDYESAEVVSNLIFSDMLRAEVKMESTVLSEAVLTIYCRSGSSNEVAIACKATDAFDLLAMIVQSIDAKGVEA